MLFSRANYIRTRHRVNRVRPSTQDKEKKPMETNVVLRSLGYEVLSDLGKGAFGTVKLATSERHSKQVAIKIMKCGKSRKFAQKYLPLELAILKRVKHQHIVQVHETIQMASGEVYIVMEALATDLRRKIIELRGIPNDQAKTWFSQLVSAVAYLHQQNIAHRDLKCENVLLTATNQVKLTDFGFARFSRGFPDLSKGFCCTRPYAAPEVLLCLPYDPKKSDVWSLGVILYVMVTKRMPFNVSSWSKLPRRQLKPLVYPKSRTVEEPCRAFISYMLRFSPFCRPSVTKVAQHPWLQTGQEPLPHNSLRSLPVRSSPHASVLPKRNTDQEEAGPSKTTPGNGEETSTPHPPAARVVGRFVVVAVPDLDVERRTVASHQDVKSLQPAEGKSKSSSSVSREIHKASSSSSEDELEFFTAQQSIEKEGQPEPKDGSSRASGGVEAVEEEYGCFCCGPLCAAVKRAANAHIVAPIGKASRSFRERIRRFFRGRYVVSNSPSANQQNVCQSASSAEAPACLRSEQKCNDPTSEAPPCRPVVEAEAVLPQPTLRKNTKRLRFPQFKILKKKTKDSSLPGI